MTEPPIISTASRTTTTRRVSVLIQKQAEAFLGLGALKTRIHNDSNRPVFMIPIYGASVDDVQSHGIVVNELAKKIPAGGSIEVNSSNYDLCERNAGGQISILFRAGDADNVEEFLRDLRDRYSNGLKLEPGEQFYLHGHLHNHDLYLTCNERKVTGGGLVAPKTRIHNWSDKPILLIPICCPDDAPLSLGTVEYKLARKIPAGCSIQVKRSEYDLNEINPGYQICIHFRAGDTDNVEEFLRDLHIRCPAGVKVESGEKCFLHYQLKDNLYLRCNERGQVIEVDNNAGQISFASNPLPSGMEFFRNAKTVRLWSSDGQYLVAEGDEVITLRDEETRRRDRARWSVEFVDNSDSVLRLKSCYGKYLAASNQPSLSGVTGRKVLQSLPSHLNSPLELEPVMEGNHVKLRTQYGTFLCANGDHLMDPDSIPHDFPHRTTILWDVEVVEREISKVLNLTEATLPVVTEELSKQTDAISLILRKSKIEEIPGSIEKLEHLEFLDAKNSLVTKLSPEVASLKKICHILIYHYEKDPRMESSNLIGFKASCSVEGFKCLEKLCFVESDTSLLNDLGNLTKLRRLGITKLIKEHGELLCVSLGKLKELKSLNVHALDQDEILNLHYLSSPPKSLRHLYLHGRLEKLPDWISCLHVLTKFILRWSHLEEDLLATLGGLPKLVELQLRRAYDGEQLDFKNKHFPKLKILLLDELEGLRSMNLEHGTLPSLEILTISRCPWLEEIPPGIRHIHPKKLTLSDMSHEFYDKAKADHGKDNYQIFKHIEEVYLTQWRAGYWETYPFPADEGDEGFAGKH